MDIRPDGNFIVKWTVNMNYLRHVLPNTFRILRTKLPSVAKYTVILSP